MEFRFLSSIVCTSTRLGLLGSVLFLYSSIGITMMFAPKSQQRMRTPEATYLRKLVPTTGARSNVRVQILMPKGDSDCGQALGGWTQLYAKLVKDSSNHQRSSGWTNSLKSDLKFVAISCNLETPNLRPACLEILSMIFIKHFSSSSSSSVRKLIRGVFAAISSSSDLVKKFPAVHAGSSGYTIHKAARL